MAQISISRRAAHAILLAIEAGIGHSDDLLREDPLMAAMSPADRRLTTMLVLGVLRWQIRLDEQIRRFLSKPSAKLDPAVLVTLRLGAFQLLHLDRIPVHAALDESVELAKRSRYRSASGLVNAVLRKVANAAQEQDRTRESSRDTGLVTGHNLSRAEETQRSTMALAPEGDRKSDSRLSAGLVTGHDFSRAANAQQSMRALAPDKNSSQAVAAHPAWMVDRWTKFFGAGAACAICVHDQVQPATAIRLSAPEVEQELVAAGITLSPGQLLTAARIVESGDITATPAFRDGRVRLQDEGSQLVAELAAWHDDSEPGRILDCCAAPGGKTRILAERNPEAHIVACEASRPRLKQLRDRLSVLGKRVECRLADATALALDSEFDLALADVPCSGTGTLSRNPEIRHRLHPDDLPRQAERQRAILASALRAVRPGGRVVYSTCSLELEENEEVIAAVLAQNSNARALPLGTALEALRDRNILAAAGAEGLQTLLTPQGFLRLIPGVFQTDGFFIAIIERIR